MYGRIALLAVCATLSCPPAFGAVPNDNSDPEKWRYITRLPPRGLVKLDEFDVVARFPAHMPVCYALSGPHLIGYYGLINGRRCNPDFTGRTIGLLASFNSADFSFSYLQRLTCGKANLRIKTSPVQLGRLLTKQCARERAGGIIEVTALARHQPRKSDIGRDYTASLVTDTIHFAQDYRTFRAFVRTIQITR